MASINDIIKITVTNSSKSVSQTGFGTLLFITDSVPVGFSSVVKSYSTLSEMVTDGFKALDKAYLAASCYFAQSPTPAKIMIAPRTHADATTLDDFPTCIGKINNVNSDWYALCVYTKEAEEIIEIATTIESMQKIFACSSSDTNILNTGFDVDSKTPDLFTKLKKLGFTRTSTIYSGEDTKFPECGFLGQGLAQDAGTATFCYKNIAGISVDSLSTTAEENVFAKSGNTFEFLAGQNITRSGTTVSGGYIDITIGIDYISAKIQEAIYSLLVNNPKIPYTDAGITSIQSQITGVLNNAQDLNIIDQYSVKVPESSAVSTQDKASRTLTNIYINLTMSGAIQKVNAQIIYQL